MVRIVGTLDEIHAKFDALKTQEIAAWLEIEYTGNDIIGNLREMVDEATADSAMKVLRIKNRRVMDRVISTTAQDETLDDLNTGDVFTRCLEAYDVPDEDREDLTASYNQIIKDLMEEDRNAE